MKKSSLLAFVFIAGVLYFVTGGGLLFRSFGGSGYGSGGYGSSGYSGHGDSSSRITVPVKGQQQANPFMSEDPASYRPGP